MERSVRQCVYNAIENMLKQLSVLLLKLSGWTVHPEIPKEAQRCVMIAAPHTSNWDLWYARLAFFVMDIPLKFTIKREWMRFPLNLLIGPMGGIGIDRRSPKEGRKDNSSYIQLMANLFKERDRLSLLVTPEATRSLRTEWKTGFYYVAKKADVPICLGYLDYKNKVAGVGGPVFISGDIDADLRKIMAFYQPIQGKYPEKFSIDTRYRPE